MTNPKYLVNISWTPGGLSGQSLVNVGGVTYSMITRSDGYFVSSMPEIKLYASGSSYTDALTNLLLVASASTDDGGYPPLGLQKAG
jgi:hypothetical protein